MKNLFGPLTIGKRLILFGVLGSLLPLLLVGGIALWQSEKESRIAEKEILKQAYADLDHILQGVNAMLHAQQEVLEQKVASDLNVAANELAALGGLRLGEQRINWPAKNQFSGAEQQVQLPQLFLGDTPIIANSDLQQPSPLVDKVKNLVGGTCTLFQRMNENGDMLRVVTNVATKASTRAINTYIPAINPDGKPNPVIAAVLRGERFIGRAFVVNAWYITAYEPLRAHDGSLVGMLYVGIPQESASSLRREIEKITIGTTGYVYVLDSAGTYVLSKNGSKDGQAATDILDAQGRSIGKDLIEKALAVKPGEIVEERYAVKNVGETEARMKVARLLYFPQWDWIVGAGTYEEELLAAQQQLQQLSRRGKLQMAVVLLFCLLLLPALWAMIARGLSTPVRHSMMVLNRVAEGDLSEDVPAQLQQRRDELGEMSRALQIMVESLREVLGSLSSGVRTLVNSSGELTGVSSQTAAGVIELAERSHSVAAAAEEASSNTASVASGMNQTTHSLTSVAGATEEMSATVGEIAANSERARVISEQAMSQTQAVTQTMQELGNAAREIDKVTETINEISSQTNLLALNATIEAARAGAAGKGFAVVAGEIKELARQTAEATEDIKQRISGIQTSSGSAIADIGQINQVIRDVGNLVNSIAAAIEEQSVVTRDVAGNIARASSEVQDANERLAQTANVSQAIAADVAQVTTRVEEIRQGNTQVQGSATELAALADQLNGLIQKFRV